MKLIHGLKMVSDRDIYNDLHEKCKNTKYRAYYVNDTTNIVYHKNVEVEDGESVWKFQTVNLDSSDLHIFYDFLKTITKEYPYLNWYLAEFI